MKKAKKQKIKKHNGMITAPESWQERLTRWMVMRYFPGFSLYKTRKPITKKKKFPPLPHHLLLDSEKKENPNDF
jgi:hypothetical protein